MRIPHWLLLAPLFVVSACNIATSERPLFASAQRSSSLLLEDGLWTRTDPDCAVDTTKPKRDWPKCAGWLVLQGSKVVAGSDMKPDETPQDVFIVDGKPPLIQALVKVNGSSGPGSGAFYAYLVFQPMDRSAAGHVTKAEVWPVACGTDKPDGNVNPLPGFGKDCRTKSVTTLRSSAAKPKSADVKPFPLIWVRAETP